MKRMVIFLLLSLFFVLDDCKSPKKGKNPKGKGEQLEAINVDVVLPGYREMKEVIEVSGNIEPMEQAYVYAKQGGIVEQVFVDVGEMVEEGELLAKIDDSEIKLSYYQADSAFRSAADKYNRYKDLFEKQMVSEQEFRELERAYRDARSNRELYLLRWKNTEVRSPISGTVIERNCEPHQMVGTMERVFTVANMSKYKIVVYVPETEVSKLSLRQPVEIRVDALQGVLSGDRIFLGEIERISPAVNTDTGTVEVVVVLASESDGLKPGMFARLRIITSRKESAMVIPRKALVSEEPPQVWVVEQNKSILVPIELGIKEEDYVEVKGGLSSSQMVVIRGQQALTDRSSVKVVNQEDLSKTLGTGINPENKTH